MIGFEAFELGAEGRDLVLEGLVLVAADQVQVGRQTVRPGADDRPRLLAGGLGQAHGGGGEAGDLVQERVTAVHGACI